MNANEMVIRSAIVEVDRLMTSTDANADPFHVRRVWKNSKLLLEKEREISPEKELNSEIVQLAALFHDITDMKLLENFAKKINYDKKMIDRVIFCVKNLSWKTDPGINDAEKKSNFWNTTADELSIVKDASRLDAVGATGLLRSYAFTVNFTSSSPRPKFARVNPATGSNNRSLQSLLNKQLLVWIQNVAFYPLLTESGKKLSTERTNAFSEFLRSVGQSSPTVTDKDSNKRLNFDRMETMKFNLVFKKFDLFGKGFITKSQYSMVLTRLFPNIGNTDEHVSLCRTRNKYVEMNCNAKSFIILLV